MQYGKKKIIAMSMCVLTAVYMKAGLSMTKHELIVTCTVEPVLSGIVLSAVTLR
jgi:hypothetical protein